MSSPKDTIIGVIARHDSITQRRDEVGTLETGRHCRCVKGYRQLKLVLDTLSCEVGCSQARQEE